MPAARRSGSSTPSPSRSTASAASSPRPVSTSGAPREEENTPPHPAENRRRDGLRRVVGEVGRRVAGGRPAAPHLRQHHGLDERGRQASARQDAGRPRARDATAASALSGGAHGSGRGEYEGE